MSRRELITVLRVEFSLLVLDSLQAYAIMPEVEIRFYPEPASLGSFRLLELPPDLCTLIESSVDDLKFVST